MYKLCKTEQSAARQRQLEAGLLSVMENKRFDEISISDLCATLGIPRKSFYRYFSSKEGALHALIDHTLMDSEQLAGVGTTKDGVVRLELEHFFQFWQSNKRLLDALERNGLSGVLVDRAVQQALTESVVYTGGHAMQFHFHAASFITTGLMSMALTWHHAGYPQTPHELSIIATQMLTHPLIPGN